MRRFWFCREVPASRFAGAVGLCVGIPVSCLCVSAGIYVPDPDSPCILHFMRTPFEDECYGKQICEYASRTAWHSFTAVYLALTPPLGFRLADLERCGGAALGLRRPAKHISEGPRNFGFRFASWASASEFSGFGFRLCLWA